MKNWFKNDPIIVMVIASRRNAPDMVKDRQINL